MPVYRPPESATPPSPRRRWLPFLASLALELAMFIAVVVLTIGAIELVCGHVTKEAVHARR